MESAPPRCCISFISNTGDRIRYGTLGLAAVARGLSSRVENRRLRAGKISSPAGGDRPSAGLARFSTSAKFFDGTARRASRATFEGYWTRTGRFDVRWERTTALRVPCRRGRRHAQGGRPSTSRPSKSKSALIGPHPAVHEGPRWSATRGFDGWFKPDFWRTWGYSPRVSSPFGDPDPMKWKGTLVKSRLAPYKYPTLGSSCRRTLAPRTVYGARFNDSKLAPPHGNRPSETERAVQFAYSVFRANPPPPGGIRILD